MSSVLFTDTVTVYNKISATEWRRTVIKGVQWRDKVEKNNMDGVISIVQYASVTFQRGTYEQLTLAPGAEEDCIVYGETDAGIVINGERGHRISDLLQRYPRSGIVKSVSDNTMRRHLQNKKVVLA